jgi:tetratricopeptide (TPR) repeat protein
VLSRNNAKRCAVEQMNINIGRGRAILLILALVSTATTPASVSGTQSRATAIDPKVAGFVKQADSALKSNQYDLAIRHFTAALQMKPETKTAAVIYSWRANAYIHKGDLDRAMSDASESIRLNPHDDHGYLERGIVYRRTGRLEKAIGDYDTTIHFKPNFARAYYDRAIAYALQGDYNQAIRDNTEAIHLNRNDADYADFYYNRGLDYQAVGNLDKAIADFNEAIRRAPKQLNNYCGRASTFEDIGQLDKASADYDQVTRSSPKEASDYLFRGSAHFAKGNYKAAASDFETASRLSPKDYDVLASLAWFQATCPENSLRNGNRALEKSLRACELSRWQSSNVVDTLAAAYAEIGDFDRAVKYQTQAISMKGAYALRRKEMQERLELYRQHKPYRKESKFKPH